MNLIYQSRLILFMLTYSDWDLENTAVILMDWWVLMGRILYADASLYTLDAKSVDVLPAARIHEQLNMFMQCSESTSLFGSPAFRVILLLFYSLGIYSAYEPWPYIACVAPVFDL